MKAGCLEGLEEVNSGYVEHRLDLRPAWELLLEIEILFNIV